MRLFCFSVGKGEVEGNRILKCGNKAMIIVIGRNVDKGKYKCYNKVKLVLNIYLMAKWLPH
jgi:hypothetical protein